MAPCPRLLGLTLAALLIGGLHAAAQDTRAELLAAERQRKAEALRPYVPTRLERLLLWVEQREPLRRIAPYDGFYLQYGFSEKPVGAGIAVGGGFRHDLFDRHARFVLETGVSMRNYQLLRTDFSMPYLAGHRLELGLQGEYRDRPQEDFYGLGPWSRKEDRVSFRYQSTDIQARLVARPRRWLELAARAGQLHPTVGPGKDTRFPTPDERFATATLPGFVRQPTLRYVEGGGAVDTRDQKGNPRAGGFYSLTWRRYTAADGSLPTFRAVDADLQRFFPIFDKKRVVALRGRAISTAAAEGGDVPFYLQPTLGGSDSLRGYADYRFRDRNIMYLNAEYRWEAFSGLDMALFSDWGKVATRDENLHLGSLEWAYGIGFRFNTYKTVFFRMDIAAGGGDGLRYFLKFSNVF